MTPRRSYVVARVARLFVTTGFLVYVRPASATEPVILVDAVSMLKSNAAGDPDAVPILLSDIEFEAALLISGRDGPSGLLESPSPKDWRQAKERALVIRLLADQARRLHETASPEDKQALFEEIVGNLGGVGALNQLLARTGVPRDAVDRWIENATLALGQLRFLRDQIALPVQQRRPQSSGDGEEDAVHGYRKMVDRNTEIGLLRARLIDIAAESRIRVLR